MGKTSLTLRFCKGNFDDKQISTIDASCLSQTIQVGGGGKVQVNIWDTAGQERYHALNKVYYQGAEGELGVTDWRCRCPDRVRYNGPGVLGEGKHLGEGAAEIPPARDPYLNHWK